jgi:F0F1-type ATP synthase assembly protein I
MLPWRRKPGAYRDVNAQAHEAAPKRHATRIHAYAIELPMGVIVGAALGAWVDKTWSVAPWGIAVGLVAGIGASVRSVVRLIRYYRETVS